ncbi:MAG: RHS repeat-associated core domain-containing protein [Pseudomonadota bacterium]
MSMYQGTPEVTVLDNQGQEIRALHYYRATAGEPVQERIERTTFNPLGQTSSQVDNRLYAAGDDRANVAWQHSLAGQILRTESPDTGASIVLYDAEGRPCWQRDARGTEQAYAYDRLGRLVTRTETSAAGTSTLAERLIYGEDQPDAAARNLNSQLYRHYDTAGLTDLSAQGYTILGTPCQQNRQLLPAETTSDWQSETEANWQTDLEQTVYTTDWCYDARTRMIRQTDAQGHQQDYQYDCQNRLQSSQVTPQGGTEQTILDDIQYTAAGQKAQETAGNGVQTTYQYEPETQRLLRVDTDRADGALQQLTYTYDPVGNVLSRTDAAQAASASALTPATRTYTYDSLYQLISATGRENANASAGIDNPAAAINPDLNQYKDYTRSFEYDTGGNLIKITHQGATNYVRNITVSDQSNQALLAREGLTATTVSDHFDVAGNQQTLNTGQSLTWDGRNQLSRLTTIARSGADDDRESYLYDASGQRVRKTNLRQTSGSQVCQQTIYLPGLERHTTTSGSQVQEELDVILIGQAGRSQVRVLCWQTGKPDAIPDQQIRYSLDDLLGSSQLELDAEGKVLTQEEYYPYGGTAIRAAKSQTEVKYKIVRYSGKERDASGLYYYGMRYYQPWLGRWLNADPEGTADGLNVYRMVQNNPATFVDPDGTRTHSFHTAVEATLEFMQEQDTAADAIRRGSRLVYAKAAAQSLARGIVSSVRSLSVLPFLFSLVSASVFAATAILGPERFGKWMIGKMQKYLSKTAARHPHTVGATLGGATATAFGGDTVLGAAVGLGAGTAAAWLGRPEDTTLAAPAGGMAVGVASQHGATPMGQLGGGVGGVTGGLIAREPAQAARAGYWAGIGGALGSQIGRRLDQLFSFSTMTGMIAHLAGTTSSRLISLALRQVRHTGPAEAGLALSGGVAGGVGGAAGPGTAAGGVLTAAVAYASGAGLAASIALSAVTATIDHITGAGSAWDDTVSHAATAGMSYLSQCSNLMSWARWGTLQDAARSVARFVLPSMPTESFA